MRAHRTTSLSAVLGVLAMPCALASGFQLQEQSASGLGVAYSGMAVAGQDASTVFWNPAAMSLIAGSQAALAIDYVVPEFRFTSAGAPPTGSTYNAFGNGGDGGVSAVVPALYAKLALTSRASLGLAVNAPFGLSTQWNAQWAGMFHAIKSEVDTVNINPSVSYRINDVLSLGAGVSYERLRATLTQGVTPLLPSAQARVDGSDWSWGWNAGALLELNSGTHIGLAYRSSIGYRLSGTLAFNNAAFSALDSGATASLRLPSVASIAISQSLGTRVRALADFTRTQWDSVQQLTIVATSGPAVGQPVSNEQLSFSNSWRAGLGLEYRAAEPWLLRAGVAYDRSPVQDAFRTPRLPDNDRKWLAVGARFMPEQHFAFDVGYAYLWVQSAASELGSAGPVPGALRGTYDLKTSIVGAQVTYSF